MNNRMMTSSVFRSITGLALGLIVSAGTGPSLLAGQGPATFPPSTGILVMAHGGTPAWDGAVAEAVAPVKAKIPTALALGMADPHTMQAALDSLREQGATRIAVVRLFLSGESFLHDTEFYLGLRDDAPAVTMAMMMSHGPGEQHDMGPPKRLDFTAEILLEMRGLSEGPLTASIVADRAHSVSTDPAHESVIVVAHGMGDEGENQRVLDNMAASVEALRGMGFAHARAATLREDWPEVRVQAETDIRNWVQTRAEAGDRVIVVPFRLFGFGGYAEVLEGLAFTPADGLLPHPLISQWIEQSAADLFSGATIYTPRPAQPAVNPHAGHQPAANPHAGH